MHASLLKKSSPFSSPVKLPEQHAKYARDTGSLLFQGGDEIMIAPFFTGKQEDSPIIAVGLAKFLFLQPTARFQRGGSTVGPC